MFSKGQLIFAGFFIIAFLFLMMWSYSKDVKRHQVHYKDSALKVGIICILVIFVFMVLRVLIHGF